MKWLIASDIHGSAYFCDLLLNAFEREKADRLLLLGDLLYHGPRNELPKEYAPKKVIEMLNSKQDSIFCVRGNCDTEVDQMVLDFPILSDYFLFNIRDRLVFTTHGHQYNANNLPKLHGGDILLHGHTHIPACEKMNGIYYLNPGSVSLPKNDSAHCYMLFHDDIFEWMDMNGKRLQIFDTNLL